MHERELWRKMPGFCNPVGGGDRKEGVLFMSLLLSHDVYNRRIRRISIDSYKLSVESLYKMALYNMNILSRITLGLFILFICFVCFCLWACGFLVSSSNEHFKNLL